MQSACMRRTTLQYVLQRAPSLIVVARGIHQAAPTQSGVLSDVVKDLRKDPVKANLQ